MLADDSSSSIITRQGFCDEVQKLLVVPQDHVLALPHKKWCFLAMELKKCGPEEWKSLGQHLQISNEDLCELEVIV